MGVILSRFRSKLSTKEILEDIEKKLKSIDEFQQDTMERQKRVARRLLVIFIVVYIIAIASFIFITSIQKFKLYYFTGLAAFAVLAWLAHKGMRWYYTRQMVNNSEKSVELRKKKKKILEDVMDTETYKVAKEILDKFGDKPQPSPLELRGSPSLPLNRQGAPGTELRQRQVESRTIPAISRNNATNLQPPATPNNAPNPMKLPQQQMLSTQRPVAMNYGHAPLRPLPRPILPRERGMVDRMMDFFVGDGPHQRYALICRHCGGHNGMALQEEFEYVSYYCCYCYQFNPPRKMRPMAPRLPLPPPPLPQGPKAVEETKKEVESEEKSNATKVDDKTEDSNNASNDDSSSIEEDESSVEDDSEQVSEKMEVDAQEEDNSVSDGQESSSLR